MGQVERNVPEKPISEMSQPKRFEKIFIGKILTKYFSEEKPTKVSVKIGQVLLTPDEFFKKYYKEVMFPRSILG